MKKPRAKPLRLKGIKRVKRVRANGSIEVELYFRKTGAKLDPDNLVQSYAAAEKAVKTRARGTLVDLIRLWDTDNPVFDALKPATREAYPWKLKKIEAKWGGVPTSTFDSADDADAFAADALAWHLSLGKTSLRSADNLMSALCRVLSFAKEKRRIKHHPLPTFKRLYKSDRAEMTWSDDLVGRFIESARPAMVTAMYLVRNLGQRQKDLRELAKTKYDGATIEVRQSKGGKFIRVPVTKELKAHLDALPADGLLFLVTPQGKAFTKRRFNECWREDADKVGAGDLNFHDLRGTAATRLAEAGATAPMIASVMGWSIEKAQKIIDTYIARSGLLAAAGIELLEAHRARTKPVS